MGIPDSSCTAIFTSVLNGTAVTISDASLVSMSGQFNSTTAIFSNVALLTSAASWTTNSLVISGSAVQIAGLHSQTEVVITAATLWLDGTLIAPKFTLNTTANVTLNTGNLVATAVNITGSQWLSITNGSIIASNVLISAQDVTISAIASNTTSIAATSSVSINGTIQANMQLSILARTISYNATFSGKANVTFYAEDSIIMGENIRIYGSFINLSSSYINIPATSYISADGTSIGGPGIGTIGGTSFCAGAGHGGTGGQTAPYGGGPAYGSVFKPIEAGSQGGACGTTSGGAGGGAVHITASTLVLEGNITANGIKATTIGGSGGSGGSILLETDSLAGRGYLFANGGPGSKNTVTGGSGAGGRVAVYSANTIAYTGEIVAVGGSGINIIGAPGTIYTQFTDTILPKTLRVDNAHGLTVPTFVERYCRQVSVNINFYAAYLRFRGELLGYSTMLAVTNLIKLY